MIGVFGGTFDPPHLGHIHLIKALIRRYHFSKFYLIPTSQNPLKPSGPRISSTERLRLVQTAVQEFGSGVEVLDWEISQSGPSYTIDTVKRLSQFTREPLAFVMGNDLFSEISQWKSAHELLQIMDVIVVIRDPENVNKPQQLLHKLGIMDSHFTQKNHLAHSQNQRWIDFCEIDALPISSTAIRAELADMWKKNKLDVPPQGIQRSVWLLIKENRLYTVD